MSTFNDDQKNKLICIILSAIITIGIAGSEFLNFISFDSERSFIRFLLYIIPYLIVGFPVVKGSLFDISKGRIFDEEFLMTIATAGALFIGEYTEAVAVMLLYQIGELFQDYAVNKSRRSIKELMEIAPTVALREIAGGDYEEIEPDDVRIGDILIVKPGEKIPVDGAVVYGESEINTSALTGEALPIFKKIGDKVLSGCVNGESLIKIKAEKEYIDSTVAIILELVEESMDKKSKSEKFITKFSRYYTPIVVISALALLIIPGIITSNWMEWMMRACTFLVISCPCALVISVPLAFFGGVGAASREGILVKGSNYLEALTKVKTIITDKTGTLTTGEFQVTDVYAASDYTKSDVLRLASYLESYSNHPIANSICLAYDEIKEKSDHINKDEITDVKNESGLGIRGYIDEELIIAGNKKMMDENNIDTSGFKYPDNTSIYVSKEGKLVGIISISDSEKKEARDALRLFKDDGVENFIMLTGDRKESAEKIAEKLGINEYYYELLPQDKVKIVEELIDQNKNDKNNLMAYLGDGINDAPVLSRVDVGIAMGGAGSDAAIEAADIVIMDDKLRRIDKAFRIAKRTVKISWQNIVFAIFIKILFLILGAFGIIGMWWAVFADVGVAVICILNSMRMLKKHEEVKKLDFIESM